MDHNRKRTLFVKTPLLIGGSITLLIGIGHIFMPTMGYEETIPQAMQPVIRDHFYYLATYAICSFLLAFGLLSICFSRIKFSLHTIAFSWIMALVWIARVVLEFVYPVEVRIFMLGHPHEVLRGVIVVLTLLYLIPSVYFWVGRNGFVDNDSLA